MLKKLFGIILGSIFFIHYIYLIFSQPEVKHDQVQYHMLRNGIEEHLSAILDEEKEIESKNLQVCILKNKNLYLLFSRHSKALKSTVFRNIFITPLLALGPLRSKIFF